MVIGIVKFAAEVRGLQLPQMEISSPQPKIDKVKLRRQGDEPLRVEFDLIDVFDGQEAKSIVRPVLESILNQLVLQFDISVGEPRLSSLSLPQDESANSIEAETRFPLVRLVTKQDVTPNDAEIQRLTATLGQPRAPAHLFSAYRNAASQDDAVTRFMFLYSLLLQLLGDNQGAVETYIQKEDRGVVVTPSPHKSGTLETVYTRLRNEVGHVRQGVTPEQTRLEIVNNVDAFQQLVKTALLQKT